MKDVATVLMTVLIARDVTDRSRKEVNVGRSLAADRRKKAKTKVAKGQGDRGDTWALTLLARRTVRVGSVIGEPQSIHQSK